MTMDLYGKLDARRFPNMSLQMAAILGLVLERYYTTATLTDVQVTPEGHALAWPAEQEGVGHSMHLGGAADLPANLRRLGMAAGLDSAEWTALGDLVRRRFGIELDADTATRE